MAENKKQGKQEVTIEAKHVLAVYDVPKSSKKHLESRTMLQGVHVEVDDHGKWRVEATDSFKVARISSGYAKAGHAFGFTLPPEAIGCLKPGDVCTFEPDGEGACHAVIVRKGAVVEHNFRLVEGNYPNIDQLMPSGLPRGCYRYAADVDADNMAVLMGVVKKAFGKGHRVEVATMENEKNKPVMAYAKEGDLTMTLLVMPLRYEEGRSELEKPRPLGKADERNRELRDELKAAQANAEMWKRQALKHEQEAKDAKEAAKGGADKRNAELEGELAKAKAERDEFARKFREEKAKRVEQKGEQMDDGKVKELEAELSKARAELEKVWKENEVLKASQRPQEAAGAPKSVPPAPKPPKAAGEPQEAARTVAAAAIAVTLEYMEAWAAERGLLATQKREGCCIWVEGDSKPYADELKELGFKFTGKRKSWYFDPKSAKSAA